VGGRSLAKKGKPIEKGIKADAAAASDPPTAQPPAKSTAAVMAMGSDATGNVAYCSPPEEFATSTDATALGGIKIQPLESDAL
jgi:hypothetical protein